MVVNESEFLEQLAAFGEHADEMAESTIRILAFVSVSSVNRKVVAKDYRTAIEDTKILMTMLEALARRSAQ